MNEWITWNGGKCPVPPGTLVDIKFRKTGELYRQSASKWTWDKTGRYDDIVAYCLSSSEGEPTMVEDKSATFDTDRFTVRDRFASAALTAFLSRGVELDTNPVTVTTEMILDEFAEAAYMLADAMMKVREEGLKNDD